MTVQHVEQKVLTLPEHPSSSPTCGAESTYPSRAAEFIPYMWSRKYLPFQNTWVHPLHVEQKVLTLPEHMSSSPTCGAESTYPSRAPEFIPYMWSRKYLPFQSTWVHPLHVEQKVLTLPEHLSSSPTCGAESTYHSRAPEFIPYMWSRKYLPF
jgi:hypothetical protein